MKFNQYLKKHPICQGPVSALGEQQLVMIKSKQKISNYLNASHQHEDIDHHGAQTCYIVFFYLFKR